MMNIPDLDGDDGHSQWCCTTAATATAQTNNDI